MADASESAGCAPGTGYAIVSVINRGGWANGDVFLVRTQYQTDGRAPDSDGDLLVVKSYSEKNALVRSLGRYLLNREKRAYRILKGNPGIPGMIESENPHVLVMQYIPGQRLKRPVFERAGPEVMAGLRAALDAMHDSGLCHMDLRNQGNILVTDENQVYLLDFASSVKWRGRWFLTRWLGRLYRRFDEYGFRKWQLKSENLYKSRT